MGRFCAVCSAKAPHRCSSCSLVAYCSAEHQKEHWKIHRKNCPYFKIVEVSKLGKGFIATRDIKPGTVILDEDPVAVAPTNRSQFSCVTCGCFYPGARKCFKCKLRVCSFYCEKLPLHANNECRIFASQEFRHFLEYSYGVLVDDLVLAIRVCMLKRRNSALYRQVLELCSEYELPYYESETETVETYLKMMLSDAADLYLSSADIAKLLKIFHINCFTSSQEQQIRFDLNAKVRSITGLYLRSSRINHSCIPNCHWELGSKPEFKIRIRTTMAVKKGEALTVCYYMDHIGEGTELRQQIIRKNGYFRCECPRCKDPTEFGTYVSGIVCKTCRNMKTSTSGYLLSENPLNLNADAKWKCNCCGEIKLARLLLPQVEKYAGRISRMESKFGHQPDDNRFIVFCMELINETSGVTLHPNHWIIQKAIAAAGNYFVRCRRVTISLVWSEYFVKCCKQLLSILDVLTPGLTRSRANVQVQLARALNQQYNALLSQQTYEQVDRICEECEEILKEALKFYKNELPMTEDMIVRSDFIKENMSRVSTDRMLFRLNNLDISG